MKQDNITRRGFLSGIGAAVFAASLPMDKAQAASVHPLGHLDDITTLNKFEPRAGAFGLVLFMTAQELYPGCGGAFVGAGSVLQYRQSAGIADIQPILVIPKVSDQPDPQDLRNLDRALAGEPRYTVLTGALPDIVRAASNVGQAFYEIDKASGKVTGHTLDAFFLTPSGNRLFSHRAEDSIVYTETVDKMLSNCTLPRNEMLCL